jgi:hypothetical protein
MSFFAEGTYPSFFLIDMQISGAKFVYATLKICFRLPCKSCLILFQIWMVLFFVLIYFFTSHFSNHKFNFTCGRVAPCAFLSIVFPDVFGFGLEDISSMVAFDIVALFISL